MDSSASPPHDPLSGAPPPGPAALDRPANHIAPGNRRVREHGVVTVVTVRTQRAPDNNNRISSALSPVDQRNARRRTNKDNQTEA
ncbi:hypothetical protein EYF80_063310 [Liparis tanakae]|uniref:Uncharacterized protein n=1 Tax=Liparis tanakae TaxID=230148 RepID=A0A4Z2EDH9_9TELE|nr:hypothetical protein EYF80_063310 [Liparis tanakae]